MARKSESDNLNMVSNEHQKLLKQKLKSLGIDEKEDIITYAKGEIINCHPHDVNTVKAFYKL